MDRHDIRPAVGSTTTGDLAAVGERDIACGVLPRLQHVVAARGEHVAVDDGTTRVSFAELAVRAAAIRARLEDLMAGRPVESAPAMGTKEPVALLAGHDAASVIALVALLASGHPVVVLDERTPAAWQRRLLAQVGADVVVADASRADVAAALVDAAGGTATLLTTTDESADAGLLWRDLPPADAPAVIAFTSGTTGATKPVVGSHRLLVRDAWNSAVASCCYDADDVVVHTLPLPFHAGLTTTIHTLLVGCGMRLVDVRATGVATLPDTIAHSGATLLVTSPAILRSLVASGPDPDLLAGLHGLTVAGESVYARDIAGASELLGSHCVVRNRYGASEVGLICEQVVGEAPEGRLPIGRPIGWTGVDVVREDGTSADIGEKGVIVVTAPDIALGYWGRPQDPAFTDNPDGTRTFRTSDLGRRLPDGSIDLTGRSDHAVSVRGYLVDPGEVEAVLRSLPGVRECLVAGQETDTTTRLVAYVVGEAAGDPTALRARLRERLPGHMVPAEVVAMSALPRTERGKVDRRALPLPVRGDRGHEPLTHWEQLVADTWTQVLGVDDLGPDDDFFTLGGDSLSAEELMTRLRDDLGAPPARTTSRTLVQAPTLREFASALAPDGQRSRAGIVTLHAAGSRPPLFIVAGAGGLGRTLGTLARRLGADQPVHALQSPSLESRALPETSITVMARRHLASIRGITRGPLLLAGHGFGGLVALEIARLAEASGQSAPFVALLDTTPPALTRGDTRPAWRRAKSGLGLALASVRDTTGGAEAWRWQLQADTLAMGHTPTPRRGRALVLTASDGPAPEGQAAWGAVLPGMVHRHVPGGPLTMVRPPHVDAVAAHLRTALDDVLAGVTLEREPADA